MPAYRQPLSPSALLTRPVGRTTHAAWPIGLAPTVWRSNALKWLGCPSTHPIASPKLATIHDTNARSSSMDAPSSGASHLRRKFPGVLTSRMWAVSSRESRRDAAVPQYELTQWPGRRPSTRLIVYSCTGNSTCCYPLPLDHRPNSSIFSNNPTCTTSVALVPRRTIPAFRVSSGLHGGFRRASHPPSVSWICTPRTDFLSLDYIGSIRCTLPQPHTSRCGEVGEELCGVTDISNLYRLCGMEPGYLAYRRCTAPSTITRSTCQC